VNALIGLGLLCGVVVVLAGGIMLNGSRLVFVAMAAVAAAGLGFVSRDGGRAASVDLAWKAAAGTVAAIFLVAGSPSSPVRSWPRWSVDWPSSAEEPCGCCGHGAPVARPARLLPWATADRRRRSWLPG
jgi:hypothetical protein